MVRKALLCVLLAASAQAATPDPAAGAINALGLDLLRSEKPGENSVLSPYSIQIALGMTSAGAAGLTREQMVKTLHYPNTDMNLAFQTLSAQIEAMTLREDRKDDHPIVLNVANRLFGQTGSKFQNDFLAILKERYRAPLETVDFVANPDAATAKINKWTARQTHNRIRDLIPKKTLTKLTRLVLVNAIYLKAKWAKAFPESATSPQDFHLTGGESLKVPTMTRQGEMACLKGNGFTAVGVPYAIGDLQFLILLPNAESSLSILEKKLTPDILATCSRAPNQQVKLSIPKFKIEPPSLNLNKALIALGMPTAFDEPPGSADLSGMTGNRDLYISDVFHKAFLSIDEHGTEAAAATAVVMNLRGRPATPKLETVVRVDRPFLFAVQHRPSGACLFLGRVADPR
jgi:serpin B